MKNIAGKSAAGSAGFAPVHSIVVPWEQCTQQPARRRSPPEMYGSILLHEDAGGYVLVRVISFSTAVMIAVLCNRLREENTTDKARERALHNNGRKKFMKKQKIRLQQGALAVPWYFLWSLHAVIGSRNQNRCRIPQTSTEGPGSPEGTASGK